MPLETDNDRFKLTPELFLNFPAWSKQVFALRLMFTLFPGNITRVLPRSFWRLISDPDYILPPGQPVTPPSLPETALPGTPGPAEPSVYPVPPPGTPLGAGPDVPISPSPEYLDLLKFLEDLFPDQSFDTTPGTPITIDVPSSGEGSFAASGTDYAADPSKPPLPPGFDPNAGPAIRITPFVRLNGLPKHLITSLPKKYPGTGPENSFPGVKPSDPGIIKHPDAPPDASTYWEPWGAILCENHTWVYTGHDHVALNCPALPVVITDAQNESSLSLHAASGDSALLLMSLQSFFGHSGSSTLSWSDFAADPLPIPNKQMKMKFTTSGNGAYDSIYLYLKDSDLKDCRLFFEGASWGGPNDSDEGPGDGSERTFNLSDYGITGDYVNYVIFYFNQDTASLLSIDINYIVFS